MQDDKQHVCGNVPSGRTNINQCCPCLQGCVDSVEPEAHWPYLLKSPRFINWWSGLNPNRIPPPEHVCDILRNVWVCPGSVSPC